MRRGWVKQRSARQRRKKRGRKTYHRSRRGPGTPLPCTSLTTTSPLRPSFPVITTHRCWATCSASSPVSWCLPLQPTRICTPYPSRRLLGGRRVPRRCGGSLLRVSSWASSTFPISICTGRKSGGRRTSCGCSANTALLSSLATFMWLPQLLVVCGTPSSTRSGRSMRPVKPTSSNTSFHLGT